jgi:hypothetical protein
MTFFICKPFLGRNLVSATMVLTLRACGWKVKPFTIFRVESTMERELGHSSNKLRPGYSSAAVRVIDEDASFPPFAEEPSMKRRLRAGAGAMAKIRAC